MWRGRRDTTYTYIYIHTHTHTQTQLTQWMKWIHFQMVYFDFDFFYNYYYYRLSVIFLRLFCFTFFIIILSKFNAFIMENDIKKMKWIEVLIWKSNHEMIFKCENHNSLSLRRTKIIVFNIFYFILSREKQIIEVYIK